MASKLLRTNIIVMIIVLVVASAGAQAAVIFEQLPDYQEVPFSGQGIAESSNCPGFDNHRYRRADDFLLGESSLITDIHWWGTPIENPDNYNFSFTFYADNNGLPGTILHETQGSLSYVAVSLPGMSFVNNFFSSVLNTPFFTTAGEVFWLSVFNLSDAEDWYWNRSWNSVVYNAVRNVDDSVSWLTDGSVLPSLAFQLTNDAAPVPEPATMLLLGSGLAGLAGFRKRFRRS